MSKRKLLKILKCKESRCMGWASQFEEGSPERQRHLLEAFAYNEVAHLIESPRYFKEIKKYY